MERFLVADMHKINTFNHNMTTSVHVDTGINPCINAVLYAVTHLSGTTAQCYKCNTDICCYTTGESYHLTENSITSLCEFTGTETEEARPLQSEGKWKKGEFPSPNPPSKDFYMQCLCRS